MTQKVFDTDSKEDMALLWSILPDEVVKLTPATRIWITQDAMYFNISAFNINWHNKTEITRPIQEATKADVGKLCYFWDGDDEDYSKQIGLLTTIRTDTNIFKFVLAESVCFAHCRRLTKTEIEELC